MLSESISGSMGRAGVGERLGNKAPGPARDRPSCAHCKESMSDVAYKGMAGCLCWCRAGDVRGCMLMGDVRRRAAGGGRWKLGI